MCSRRRPPVIGFPMAILVSAAGALILQAIASPTARAFPTYSGWPRGSCAECHGNFRAPIYRPPSRTREWTDQFGAGALHGTHWEMVGFDCDACHLDPDRSVVSTSESESAEFPLSCIGCHGRAEYDAGGAVTGAGLRRHHWIAGVPCTPCHLDSEPVAGFRPVGEAVFPPNYDALGIDPCNYPPEYSENFAGTRLGLDNDGNGYYDVDDLDCVEAERPPETAAACGVGVELALVLPLLLWWRRCRRNAGA
jgi:hypothetical protein